MGKLRRWPNLKPARPPQPARSAQRLEQRTSDLCRFETRSRRGTLSHAPQGRHAGDHFTQKTARFLDLEFEPEERCPYWYFFFYLKNKLSYLENRRDSFFDIPSP